MSAGVSEPGSGTRRHLSLLTRRRAEAAHPARMMETLIDDCLQRGDPTGVVSLINFDGLTNVACTQLDQLVTKLLSRSEFNKVSVLLKALGMMTEDHNQQRALVQIGLPAKVCFWFRAVSQHLNCDTPTKTLHCLTENFFDYFLSLSQTSLPVHQLSGVLAQLMESVLKPEMDFSLRLEAVRTFNAVLDCLSPEKRKKIQLQKNKAQTLSQLSEEVLTAGDYELQVSLSEALCRLSPRKERRHQAPLWFFNPQLCSAFCDIRDGNFEVDCRRFLNMVNGCRSDQKRIQTFPCRHVFMDSNELFKPKEEILEQFWIDFNTGSKSVTFFIDDPNSFLWTSVHLSDENVDHYNFQIQNDLSGPCSVLSVNLIYPISHLGNTGQTVKIYFNQEYHKDIEASLEAVFPEGKDSRKCLQYLKVLPLSPSNKQANPGSKRKSRAEVLFDIVVPSTASYQSGLPLEQDLVTPERNGTMVVTGTRKRVFSDSGFLSDSQNVCSPEVKRGRDKASTSASPELHMDSPDLSPEKRAGPSEGDTPVGDDEKPTLNVTTASFKEHLQNLRCQLEDSWQKVENELLKSLNQCQQLVTSLLKDVHRHRISLFQSFDADHVFHSQEGSTNLTNNNNDIQSEQCVFCGEQKRQDSNPFSAAQTQAGSIVHTLASDSAD